MNPAEEKCVMVADEALPTGVLANTAASLGITLGARYPEVVGPDVTDASGVTHPGITTFPVPILKSDAEGLRALRQRLKDPAFQEVFTADFSDVAQSCQVYDEYEAKAARTPEDGHSYLALLLCGPKKQVNKLTGSLPLLR